MYLTVIAWVYVVLMMSVVEATSPTGTLLGAVMTFLLYGVLPLSIVVYLIRSPARRRAQKAQQAAEQAQTSSKPQASSTQPDTGGETPAGLASLSTEPAAGAPVREKP